MNQSGTIPSTNLRILAIDIGGTAIKATVVDANGELLQDYIKVKTPRPAKPDHVVRAIQNLVQDLSGYERISVGFPGFVRKGIVHTAPNLGTQDWNGINLNRLINEALGKPVRIINDADMQGLAIASGNGLELVVTLGTGFGTAFLLDGNLLPHIELAHHPVTKKYTYDTYVGAAALKALGKKKWNKRMETILAILKAVFNYDRLYIGGGNASKLTCRLEGNIEIVRNKDGIKGGARVWELDDDLFMKTKI